jgi:hypothetical protein
MDIQDILIQLGYSPMQDTNGWRMAALYRQGDNNTALQVYNDGWCQDFVTNERFNIETLVRKTLNLDDIKTKDWLKGKISMENLNNCKNHKEKLTAPEYFDENLLKDLIPDYSYWTGRGISEETCKMFKGGLCLDSQNLLGKLKKRQVLVIPNSNGKIVGFTGRTVDNDKKNKYKHLGIVKNWVWPCYLNNAIIKEKREVILVESPVCILKLFDCGIKTALCLFGTECSFSIINYLLKINPKIIFIATNNEASLVGNHAADKIYARLKKYFNYNQIKIYLPPCKDFAACAPNQIDNWYKNRYN